LVVLLVDGILSEGKASGSEKGKGFGCGLCYKQSRETEQGLYCVQTELILILTLEGLH
jgi:hypothetical protein